MQAVHNTNKVIHANASDSCCFSYLAGKETCGDLLEAAFPLFHVELFSSDMSEIAIQRAFFFLESMID